MFDLLESQWLKKKLADEKATFGSNLLGADSAFQQIPTNIKPLTSAQMSAPGAGPTREKLKSGKATPKLSSEEWQLALSPCLRRRC